MFAVVSLASLLCPGGVTALSDMLRGEFAAWRSGFVFWGVLSLTLFATGLVLLGVMRWHGSFAAWHVWVLAGCWLVAPWMQAAFLRAVVDDAHQYAE